MSRLHVRRCSSASAEVMLAARALRAARKHLSQARTLHALPNRPITDARLLAWVQRLHADIQQLVALASDVHLPRKKPPAPMQRKRAA